MTLRGVGNQGAEGPPGDRDHYCPETHDVLYSKARNTLNQRHIKRPWFNLNPFLEQTDESKDLENFVPEEGKYTKRLQSIVLCEHFDMDLPLDTKEMPIGLR